MTDLSHERLITIPAERVRESHKLWPLLPYVCVFAAGTVGLLLGDMSAGGDTGAIESKLLLLLRFMAVIKFLGVLAAAGVTHWRLATPIQGRLATAYLAALAVMGAAPGLIWSLGGIAIGAIAFHIGLLVFLALAWKDDGVARPPGRRRQS